MTLARSLSMDSPKSIFLSYSRKDYTKIEKLYNLLSTEGYSPWKDKRNIRGGERWFRMITNAIKKADFFLACLSKNTINRRCYVKKELKFALDTVQQKRKNAIFIIPVLLEACKVPKQLSEFQWIDFYKKDGWERLLQAIRSKEQQQAEKKSVVQAKNTVFKKGRKKNLSKSKKINKNNLSLNKLALFQKLEELVYETRRLAKQIVVDLKKSIKADSAVIKDLAIAKEELVEFMLKRRYLLDLFSCFDVVHSYKNILVTFHSNLTTTSKFTRHQINKMELELKTLEMAYWITIQHLGEAGTEHKRTVLLAKRLELSQQIDERVYGLKLKAYDLVEDLQKRKKTTTENLENFANLLDSFIEMIMDERGYLDSFGYYKILHHYKKAADEFYKSLASSPRVNLKHVKTQYDVLEKAYLTVTRRIKNSSVF